MAIQDGIQGLGATRIVVTNGATNMVLIQPTPGCAWSYIKMIAGGGSLEIYNCPVGSSLTAAQMVIAGTSGGYLLGTTEVINVTGPARYYLMATTGAVTVMQLTGLTAGF